MYAYIYIYINTKKGYLMLLFLIFSIIRYRSKVSGAIQEKE